MLVTKRNKTTEEFSFKKLEKLFKTASLHVDNVDIDLLMDKMNLKINNLISTDTIIKSQILSAKELIGRETPQYDTVASRISMFRLYKEVVGSSKNPYSTYSFKECIERGIKEGRLDERLLLLQLDELKVVPSRDLKLNLLSTETIIERYLLRSIPNKEGKDFIIELPQHMFMRIASGLVLNRTDEELKVNWKQVKQEIISFYETISELEYMPSTPTLFNSGTVRPQLSSCFINTVADTLTNEPGTHRYASIMGSIEECAILSKFAGGLGSDWSFVRSSKSPINSTGGYSSGIIPFIKIFNDTAVAANQAGKRKGSFAAYLEPWHADFMNFLKLKRESSDERQSAHDIFPVAWVPSLLMERSKDSNKVWSFFNPGDYPELHTLYGEEFNKRYEELEEQKAYVFQMPASEVWRKMIISLWETGAPWINFKDNVNNRNPQRHRGPVLSSNLCTEITIVTNDNETAVCNLGSVNLSKCIVEDKTAPSGYYFDFKKLTKIVRIASRMLDNVIDINFYPSERAEYSNTLNRPVGMGVMGLSEVLEALKISWDSQENLEFQDELFYRWSYAVIEASADLAQERGSYLTFKGSDWSKGILPYDNSVEAAKNLTNFKPEEKDLERLREKVRNGMRNSLVMAIAPTATICNITGTTPCIEPPFDLEYVKSNLSGNYPVFSSTCKYSENPQSAFKIDPTSIIKSAAVRQKYIDQSQSLNLFLPSNTRGSRISELYQMSHDLGCKTNYYLRLLINVGKTPSQKVVEKEVSQEKFCSIDNPNCESCQ